MYMYMYMYMYIHICIYIYIYIYMLYPIPTIPVPPPRPKEGLEWGSSYSGPSKQGELTTHGGSQGFRVRESMRPPCFRIVEYILFEEGFRPCMHSRPEP